MQLNEATIITAMVTPFDKKGNIDFDKLPALVEHLLSHHTEGLVIAGTTGESPTLTHDEEMKLFHEMIRLVDGRVPLICGVGTNDTRDTIQFVQEVAKIDGIAAGLCVVPYYNKPNQEGLYQHYKAISEASDLPILIYNIPSRSIVSLTVETVIRLAKLPNIVGIKECTGLDHIALIREHTDPDFMIFTGEDKLAFYSKLIGAQGVISVVSHVLGDDLAKMYQSIDEKDIEQAAAIQRKILPKIDQLFSVPSPAPIKAALNHIGVQVGGLRLPLVACTPEEKERILAIVEK